MNQLNVRLMQLEAREMAIMGEDAAKLFFLSQEVTFQVLVGLLEGGFLINVG